MASIQKIIAEHVQLYIRREIRKFLRLQNDENRKVKEDLAECKKRLSKLEKDTGRETEKTIADWFNRMRSNGTTLKMLRKKLDISQTELANLLNTNPATVNRWESGKVKLSRKSREKVAKIRLLSRLEVRRALQEKAVSQKVN